MIIKQKCKGKSAKPPLFIVPKFLSSASDKTKFSAKILSKNTNLDDSGIFLPTCSIRANLELLTILLLASWLTMASPTLILQRHLVLIVFSGGSEEMQV